jgi:hypothetical protein
MKARRVAIVLGTLPALCFALACGGGGGSESTGAATAAPTQGGAPATAAEAEAPPESEAPGEAESAATGDIPDNQVFLTFENRPAGYSIKYPEGWARRGSGGDVTFQEKGNVIHIVVAKGAPPTPASATAGLKQLESSDATVRPGSPERLTIAGAPVVKVTYTRLSAPDPVTGKRLPLTVDRYLYGHGGEVATLDLGTPVAVDNVDAYRMISRSFRWR